MSFAYSEACNVLSRDQLEKWTSTAGVCHRISENAHDWSGYKVAPHTHPHRENVTVLSGTLKVGMGDQFDAAKMMSFDAASPTSDSMHHYAAASRETVIQIHGQSPVKFNY